MNKLKVYLKNTALVFFAEYFYYGILFLIGVLISRFFGAKAFGDYNLIFSVAQICILTLGSAFSIILRRDMALNHEVGEDILKKIIYLRAITLFTTLVVGTLFLKIVYGAGFYLILSFFMIAVYRGFDLLNESFFIYYQAQKKMESYFRAKILMSICLAVSFYAVAAGNRENHAVCYAALAIISILFFTAQFFYFHKKRIGKTATVKTSYKYLLSESWPIIANSFFFQVNSRLSILLIGYLAVSAGSLGVYAASLSLVSAITMIGNAIAIVIFAKLTELFNSDVKTFQYLLYKICAGVFLLGAFAAVAYYFLTPLFIRMYKITDANALTVFFWCGISIPVIMLNTILGYIFTITKTQKMAMVISIINLFLSLVIIYVFTNQRQISGSAEAYFITNLLFFIILGTALQVVIAKAKKVQARNAAFPGIHSS